MQSLIDHAHYRANQPVGDRPERGDIVVELAALAGDDAAGVHKAWDYCVQCYAELEELAWLRAATYLLPLALRAQQNHIGSSKARAQARQQRFAAEQRRSGSPPA